MKRDVMGNAICGEEVRTSPEISCRQRIGGCMLRLENVEEGSSGGHRNGV